MGDVEVLDVDVEELEWDDDVLVVEAEDEVEDVDGDELEEDVLLDVDAVDEVDEVEMVLAVEAVEVELEVLDDPLLVVETMLLLTLKKEPAAVDDVAEVLLVLAEDVDESTFEDDEAEVEVKELLLETFVVPFLM
jgi:hypothetical protein